MGPRGPDAPHRPLQGVCLAAGMGEPEPWSEKQAALRVCTASCRAEETGVPCTLPALFLAFLSLDAPTCVVSPIPRLLAPSPACLFCPGSSFGDLRHRRRGRRGEGRPCEARGQTRKTLEERVQGSSLGRDRGGDGGGVVDGDVPSNLMTQHHLGRLVAASAWSSRPNKPIPLSGLFHSRFLLAPSTTTNVLRF